MQVNNPYLNELRAAYLQEDKTHAPEDIERVKDLQRKSREWTETKIREVYAQKGLKEQKMEEVKDSTNYRSVNQQYKDACLLYQGIMGLVDDIRALKKSLREEIKEKRKR